MASTYIHENADRDDHNNATKDQKHLDQLGSFRRKLTLSPASPCSGLSEECKAMAQACSHDHDYVQPPKLQSPRSVHDNKPSHKLINPCPKLLQSNTISASNDPTTRLRTSRHMRNRRILLAQKAGPDLGYTLPAPPDKKASDNTKDSVLGGYISTHLQKHNDETGIDCRIRHFHHLPQDAAVVNIMRPIQSMTPVPPKVDKNECEKLNGDHDDSTAKNIPSLHADNTCKTSVDSAYNSLNCSLSTPSFSRPPSGGKRSATCGLSSSSSSGASSDEASDADESQPRRNEVKSNAEDDCSKHSEQAEIIPEHRPTSSNTKRNVISAKKFKKVSSCSLEKRISSLDQCNTHLIPTPPPRKPKKGKVRSIPMRLRALPTSFWEEPNCTNQLSYTSLPPVYPLLHHAENENLDDPGYLSHQQDKEESVSVNPISPSSCDRHRHKPIIKTGDTDLLLRLFDKVENTKKSIPATKRGRPKRRACNMVPTYRKNRDENPCIMDSITEKLFPKLSLENRHAISSFVTSCGAVVPALPVTIDTGLEQRHGRGTKYNSLGEKAQILSHSPTSSGMDLEDSAVDGASPPLLSHMRQSPILPQLVTRKDYSLLLSELAAVL